MIKALLLSGLLILLSCSSANRKTFDDLDISLQKTVNFCKVCHSTREMQRGPLLEGLEVWYLEETVLNFKEGIRGGNVEDTSGQLMHSAVKDLPSDDIIAAVRWFAGQPRPEIIAYMKGDTLAGEKIYKDSCYGCHEHTMGKLFSRSPDLYKLEDWYLMSQLRSYKSKHRGTHPEDEHGVQMQAVAQGFTDQQFKDVTAYLATFQKKPE